MKKINTGWKAYDVKVVKSEGQWVGNITRVENNMVVFATTGTDKCDAHRKLDRALRNIRKNDKLTNANSHDTVTVSPTLDTETVDTVLKNVSYRVYKKDGVTISPVATVKHMFSLLHSTMTRKRFIQMAVDMGINKCTAATQYGHARTALNKTK